MNDPDLEEIAEQKAAQAAALSCEMSLSSIRQGLKATVLKLSKKVKTKYEWNQERVRDFRNCKTPAVVAAPMSVEDQLELNGVVSYQLMYNDPVPYLRDYKYKVYEDALQQVNFKYVFKNLRKLDMSGQLIGDERVKELCGAVRRSLLEVLILTQNKITDAGMTELAGTLRTLFSLAELNVSANNFTDAGVKVICSDEFYPPSLKLLDLSCNALHAPSAVYIGYLLQPNFQPNLAHNLESITLGGRVGKKVLTVTLTVP